MRGRDVRGLSRVGETSPFPDTWTPRRKGRDEARCFLCRLPRLDLRLPGHSRAAACPDSARGLRGAGPERFGTPRPGKSLREGEAGALGAVGRARLWGRDQEAGRRQGARPRPLVRSVGLLPTPPLSSFVSLRRWSPAGLSRSPGSPPPPPCPSEGSAARPRQGRPARPREFWAPVPETRRPARGLLSGAEACCVSSGSPPSHRS